MYTRVLTKGSMAEPTRLPRAARRAQLIESAAGTFLRRGFDSTSMDDVARDAGVSRLILYRIFDSKHDLYRAVLHSVIDHLGVAVEPYAVDALRTRGAASSAASRRQGAPRCVPAALAPRPPRARSSPTSPSACRRSSCSTPAASSVTTSPTTTCGWSGLPAPRRPTSSRRLCTWLDLGDPGARRRSRGADGRRAACPDDGVGVGGAAPRQRVTAVATASTIRSICSSVVTSGGQNVIVSGGMALVTTPSSSSRSRTAGDC